MSLNQEGSRYRVERGDESPGELSRTQIVKSQTPEDFRSNHELIQK